MKSAVLVVIKVRNSLRFRVQDCLVSLSCLVTFFCRRYTSLIFSVVRHEYRDPRRSLSICVIP